MKMDSDTDGSGGALPNPILSLKLYRRCFKGRKQLFSQSNDAAANYFITNPVPHKHSNCWRPVFYRGDNPKYTPNATAIGRARRSAMWGSFRIWLGDGVQEVLDNKKRRQERRKAERKNKWRKIFGRKKRPVDVEEEKEVQGMVVMFRMQRTGFLTRSLELEVQGMRYRWSGTRMFATGFMKRFKGWSHSMKLIRMSDRALIATFEKDLIGSRRSIKTGAPPNKSKRALGNLRIYDCPDNITSQPMRTQQDQLTSLMAHVDAATTMPSDIKDEKDLNPGGVHSGNLTEEAVVFTCWIAVEAEHRLRYKIPDLIEEIGEQIDGG